MEQKSKKSFLLTIVGTLLILILLVKYGVPTVADIAVVISGNKNTLDTTKKNDSLFVSSPILDPMVDATNSAQINISGKAYDKTQSVILSVNGTVVSKTDAKDDSSFFFPKVTLKPGQNSVMVKSQNKEGKESDYSPTVFVNYNNKELSLIIDFPNDGQTFSKDDKTIEVRGKTDPGVKVTVNGFWAIVDISGSYSYRLPLQSGENKISVEAQDEAGNTKKQERKITYSP